MIEIYGYSIATIPFVAATVYGIIELLKITLLGDNEKFKRCIPIIATALGGAIGVLVFWFAPEIMPCINWYSAILVGAASGLSAVGINQIGKQMAKGGDGGGS